jgi:hypothetical protein
MINKSKGNSLLAGLMKGLHTKTAGIAHEIENPQYPVAMKEFKRL